MITNHHARIVALGNMRSSLEPEFIPRRKMVLRSRTVNRWLPSGGLKARRPLSAGDIEGTILLVNNPFGTLLHHGCNFILVCKPESHTTLYEWLAGSKLAGDLQQCTIRRWTGRFHTSYLSVCQRGPST